MNNTISLGELVRSYFKEHHLPYTVVTSTITPSPPYGIKSGLTSEAEADEDFAQGIWLGWIYDSEFKSFDHSYANTPDGVVIFDHTPDGVVMQISAQDPQFFEKLLEWLPKCEAMWIR